MRRKATLVFGFLVFLTVLTATPVRALLGLGSATPNQGTTAGGTVVDIVALDALLGNITGLEFGGVSATNVHLVNLFTVRATTPPHAAGRVDVKLRLQLNVLGIPLDELLLTLTSGYMYVDPLTITGVSPDSGPAAGGTPVAVTGTNFRAPMTVRFGVNEGTGLVIGSATQLVIATPPGPAGPVDVTVTNAEGESAVLPGGFIYAGAQSTPTIAGVMPSSGPQSGGTAITIAGTGFQPGALVTICAASVPAVSATATSIQAITPACAPGPAPITITNPDGGTATSPTPFTYTATSTPTISGIAPGSGAPGGGTPVVIDGSGFQPGATVRIGCAAATTVVVLNAATITAVSPACPAGTTGDVVVTNPDGGTATLVGGFIFGVSAPTLSAIAPASGPVGGGTAVTVVGTNFASGAALLIGGQPATNVQLVTTGVLTALTPAGAAPGPASVTLQNRDGARATLPDGFTYTATPPGPGTNDPDDTDGDGLPNECEIKFGLDPNSGVGPDGADGDPDNDGRSNLVECNEGTHPRGFYSRYLAEGSTGPFFDLFIAMVNANTEDARTLIRYQVLGGTEPSDYLVVPALRRRTVDPEQNPALTQAAFSAVVESDVQLMVERNMQWGDGHYGSHAETSAASPSTTWYFAEGATHGSFNLFYLFQNPGETDASVEVTYLRLAPRAPVVKRYTVAAKSRYTVWVDAEGPELEEEEFSAKIVSTAPIMAERVMYADANGTTWAAGHASAGITQLSPGWFFAEGATGSFFNTFFLIANPGPGHVIVRGTYMLDTGESFTKDYPVSANSRFTLGAHADDPRLAATTFAVKFETLGGEGIIVERAMWWPTGQPWIEAHNSAGATTTGTEWIVAQGQLGGPEVSETYVLIGNTSPTTASLRVRALAEDDTVIDRFFQVSANSRFNVRMLTEFPELAGKRFGVVITSQGSTPAQITAEVSVYSSTNGVAFNAGSNAQATRIR